MATIDRFTRRTPSSLAAAAFSSLIVLVLAGCGAAATSGPATTGASAAPAAAASAAPASAAASLVAPASAVASAAASAVGGSGASGSVCDLVSAGEIESLTGAKVAASGNAGNPTVCEWQLTPDGIVSVEVYTGSDAAAGAAVWAGFQTNPSVPGVGSDARFDPSGTILLVKVGAGYAQFSVVLAAVADHKPATINLAKLVVPKLGG
jgi:hypothetical protein